MRRALSSLYRFARLKISSRWRQLRRPKGGRLGRLRRRYVVLSAFLVASLATLAWLDETADHVGEVCRERGSVAIQDACVSIGLPNVPTKGDREDWQKVRMGNCEDYTAYLEAQPDGEFATLAKEHLLRARDEVFESEKVTTVRIPGFESFGRPLATEELARSDLVRRVNEAVLRDGCKGFSFVDEPNPQGEIGETECMATTLGFLCSAAYIRVCRGHMEETRRVCR